MAKCLMLPLGGLHGKHAVQRGIRALIGRAVGFLTLNQYYQLYYYADDSEHNGRGRASPGTKPPTVTVGSDDIDAEAEAWRRRQGRSRRMSRVTRQHSYDDEIKNTSGTGGNQVGGGEAGLGK
jgi:hypothetical protein